MLPNFSSSPSYNRPTPRSWPDFARRAQEESLEYRLVQGMCCPTDPTATRLPLLRRLWKGMAANIQKLWSEKMNRSELGKQNVYRVKVKETLNRSIASLVGDVAILPQENGETVLVGSFIDQSALRSFLNQLWNLNITILSFKKVDDSNAQELINET